MGDALTFRELLPSHDQILEKFETFAHCFELTNIKKHRHAASPLSQKERTPGFGNLLEKPSDTSPELRKRSDVLIESHGAHGALPVQFAVR
jgi:hypothetical protein